MIDKSQVTLGKFASNLGSLSRARMSRHNKDKRDIAIKRCRLPIRILEESSRQVSLSHQREKKSPKKLLPQGQDITPSDYRLLLYCIHRAVLTGAILLAKRPNTFCFFGKREKLFKRKISFLPFVKFCFWKKGTKVTFNLQGTHQIFLGRVDEMKDVKIRKKFFFHETSHQKCNFVVFIHIKDVYFAHCSKSPFFTFLT